MKYIVAVFFITLIVGCTSSPSLLPSKRVPAEASSVSQLPLATPLPIGLYQGPLAVNVDGSQRKPAQSYLPLQYSADKKWPLVVMLHGFSGTADTEDTYLGLRFRVSLRGFVLLEPEGTVMPKGTIGVDGTDLSGNQFWNAIDACCDFGKTGVDDVGYITGLIEKMKSQYNIDPTRIYLIGHSNGGFMANRLGCEGGSFAAIASFAGGTYKDLKNCHVQTPIPYLHVQAVDDKTILYQNAPDYSGGKETVAQWTAKNGCTGAPIAGPHKDFVFLIPGIDTDEQLWKTCASGKDVAFWTIHPYETKGHNPHVPLYNINFMDAVLDFLFQHHS